jgi:hypothetical protein
MTAWPDLPPVPALRAVPAHAPIPQVVGSVAAIRNLPHHTILRVQTGAAAQIIRHDTAHWLAYAGTDFVDYLDPTDLAWDRHSMDSLTRMLPAVILDMGAAA